MGSTFGHVLIIEDEALIALDIETRLRDLGFASFETADSIELALALASARRPDLITADVHIRGGTGVDAVRAITTKLGDVAVVYITAGPERLPPDNAWPCLVKPLGACAVGRACAQAQALARGLAQPSLDALHDDHHANIYMSSDMQMPA